MNKCVYNVKCIVYNLFILYLLYIYVYKYIQLAAFHEPFEDVLPVNLCGFPASHVSLPPGFAYDCIGFLGTSGLVPGVFFKHSLGKGHFCHSWFWEVDVHSEFC